MSTSASSLLREIAGSADAVLFDFDGPICHLFAGYPARVIAAELRAFLASRGVPILENARDRHDPLKLLTWVASERPDLVTAVDDELSTAERSAAKLAIPTPYAAKAVESAANSGRPVGIVSNNSRTAVEQYLADHQGIASYVDAVVGRRYGHPGQMKPDPSPVFEAAKQLRVIASRCVLIGDAVTDIQAAHNAGACVIGYAKNPTKAARLTESHADVVIDSMKAVAVALAGVQRV